MARKPVGSVKRHRGKWTARVTWSRADECACSHGVGEHDVAAPRPCLACAACPRFTGKRQEWRRVAEPNSKAVAGEYVREKLRQITTGETPSAPSPLTRLTFAQLAEKYKSAHVCAPIYENGVKLRGMNDHAGVRATIDRVLVPALGAIPIAELTHPRLEELRNARLAAPKLRGGRKVVETKGTRSIARVNREMSVLRSILHYAVDLGAIVKTPMKAGRGCSLVVLAAERARDRVLSVSEEARLLEAWGATPIVRSRDYFIVALDTGMRTAEMFGITPADVDMAANMIRLPWEITKKKRARIVPMSSRVKAIMRRRIAERKRETGRRVFDDLSETIVRNDFIVAKSEAAVKDFRLHDCRATVATRLLQAGLSDAEIAMMTGHRFSRQHGGAAGTTVLRKHYLRLTPKTLDRATRAIDDVN
jgi:integrase